MGVNHRHAQSQKPPHHINHQFFAMGVCQLSDSIALFPIRYGALFLPARAKRCRTLHSPKPKSPNFFQIRHLAPARSSAFRRGLAISYTCRPQFSLEAASHFRATTCIAQDSPVNLHFAFFDFQFAIPWSVIR
jgi:hypothetical protein